jgi:hypothetical protein
MQWFVFDWLGGDSRQVLNLAGVFLLLSALFSLRLIPRFMPHER